MDNIITICKNVRSICGENIEEAVPFLDSRPIPSAIDIFPLIYLIPIKEISEKQYLLSGGLLLTWLSREFHQGLTEESTKKTARAVLYGDLFYSMAFKILEQGEPLSISIKDISEITTKYSQAWFYQQDIKDPENQRELVSDFIREDLGLLLELTADKGAEEGGFSPDQQKDYRHCAYLLSIIWAKKLYGYDTGADSAQKELLATAQKLNLTDQVKEILKIVT